MKIFAIFFFLLGVVTAFYEEFFLLINLQDKTYPIPAIVLIIIGFFLAIIPESNGK
jgi:hypothetical protein